MNGGDQARCGAGAADFGTKLDLAHPNGRSKMSREFSESAQTTSIEYTWNDGSQSSVLKRNGTRH